MCDDVACVMTWQVHALPRNEWLSLMSPLTPLLLAKLGDSNQRVKGASEVPHYSSNRPPSTHF